MFFELSTAALALLIVGLLFGATALGAFLGHRVRHLSESLSEPFGVLQAALLGVVGLILAFGLSLAVTRYEDRRASIVEEANAIGTTYLRAQTLPEPERSQSLRLLTDYTESAIRLADNIPGSSEEEAAAEEEERIHRSLWALAGDSLDAEPVASAPRLYVETLNEMIDAQTTRLAALNNRVPGAVLLLEMLGAAFALGLLAAYLTLLGRGVGAVFIAAGLVAFLLFVTCDLDRPTRGPIQVPAKPLVDQLDTMQLPPAASAPGGQAQKP